MTAAMRQTLQQRATSRWGIVSLFVLLWLPAMIIAVQFGAVPVSLSDWVLPWQQSQLTGGSYVLWHIRLPRVVFALLIGAGLGLAGALAQGLFRNPLADPGLLGVSTGAAAFVAVTLVFLAEFATQAPPVLRQWLLPIMAFTGALAVCLSLDKLSRLLTAGSVAGLLLSGIAINAIAAAVTGLCTYLATDEQLRNLSFWTLGSLAAASWLTVSIVLVLLFVAYWLTWSLRVGLNALALGEQTAKHVGINVNKLRTHIVWLIALVGGMAVAWCGVIGFIGLVAPHIARLLFGADHTKVIPSAMLIGGVLLLVADTIARVVAIPAEVPVGIFTALLGGPFFLILLYQSRLRLS
jgi:iron complex transport system permease protein